MPQLSHALVLVALGASLASFPARAQESGPIPPTEVPPGSRVATVTAGLGNAMGWYGAQGELYIWADRVTAFMGLGYTPRDFDFDPSGITGAIGARGYTGGRRHRGFVELSFSQVAVQHYPLPQQLYGPGLQVGYQFVSRRGITFLTSAGAGYARMRGPVDGDSPVYALLGLGVGYTWRR
jgi:opacity protein-like surface antigen